MESIDSSLDISIEQYPNLDSYPKANSPDANWPMVNNKLRANCPKQNNNTNPI